MDKDKKDLTPEELASKLDELETKLTTLTQERDTAIAQSEELQKQVNALRITGLTQKVEPISQPQDEEIKFDFDL